MASDDRLAAGRAAFAAGRWGEAAALFRLAIAADPASMAGWANLAGASRRIGGAAECVAESALRRALAVEPTRAELHFNLGNLLRAGGRSEAAVEPLRRALAIRPDLVEALVTLGLCAHESGRAGSAVRAVRRALVVHPEHMEARVNFAALLTAAGCAPDAVEASAEALRLRPEDAGPWRDRAVAFLMLGRSDEAQRALERSAALDPAAGITWFRMAQVPPETARGKRIALLRRAVRLDPADVDAGRDLSGHLMADLRRPGALAVARQAVAHRPDALRLLEWLGDMSNRAGRPEDGERWGRRVLRFEGDNPKAYAVLMVALRDRGRMDAARSVSQQALALWPDDQRVLVNVAVMAVERSDWLAVERLTRRALHLDPSRGPVHYILALALRGQGRTAEALRSFDDGVRLAPEMPRERFNRAAAILASGDLERGLEEYEWRWHLADFPAGRRLLPQPSFPFPVWQGEALSGRRLLVWGEQGVGDEIWDAGNLPAVLRRAAGCIVECEPRLVPLFRRSFPAATVVERTAPPDPRTARADVQCPMGSLLRHVRPLEGLPPPGYLCPDADLTARLRARYRRDGRPVVGISWRSRKPVVHRSFAAPLGHWAPILSLAGANILSLQYGDVSDDVAEIRHALGIDIQVDADIDALSDLDAFAAQVAACDVVVSIANATVPMAHAVGRPAVAVLRHDQDDWRYGGGCPRPPPYPLVRTVRQCATGDWAVALQCAAELAADVLSGRGTCD
ncbi:tetratricopeptide repeat protein [Azospirillum sp. ST 5-10]|uniref:tetratricopeptide repeat protein n=1 Tax=unclassified Azospirillum TaxID=2630922 RepID=UPI003F4A1C1D